MISKNLSVTLAVKDLNISRKFYENLGFKQFSSNKEQNWILMKSASCVIALFEWEYEKNNADSSSNYESNEFSLDLYPDYEDLKRQIESAETEIINNTDENSKGPASFMIMDPDGNAVFIDQHH